MSTVEQQIDQAIQNLSDTKIGQKPAVLHVSRQTKVIIALALGLLFFLLASPFLVELSQKLGEQLGVALTQFGGMSLTTAGLVIHGLVYAVVVYLLLSYVF